MWATRTGQTGTIAARAPTPAGRTFPGAYLSPGARPGWLAWLGGFPQGEVIRGPLLTQTVCRDAQVTCRHEEAGHPVLPVRTQRVTRTCLQDSAGQSHITARPRLGVISWCFEFPLICLVSTQLHHDQMSVLPQPRKLPFPRAEPHPPVPQTPLGPVSRAAKARIQ